MTQKKIDSILNILGNNSNLVQHDISTSSAFLNAESRLGTRDLLGKTISADIEAITDIDSKFDRIRLIQEGFYSTNSLHPLSHQAFVKDPKSADAHIQTALKGEFYKEPIEELKKLGLPHEYSKHMGRGRNIHDINKILSLGTNVGVWNIGFEGRAWTQDVADSAIPVPFSTTKGKNGAIERNILGLTDDLAREAVELDALSWQSLGDSSVKARLRGDTVSHAKKIIARLGQSGKKKTEGILFDQAAIARGFLAKMEQKGIDTGILGDYRTGVSVDVFGQAFEQAGIWTIGKEKHLGLYDAAQAHHITNILANAIEDDSFFDKIANTLSPHLGKARATRAGELAAKNGLNQYANFETEVDFNGEKIPIKGSKRRANPLTDEVQYAQERGVSAAHMEDFKKAYNAEPEGEMLKVGNRNKRIILKAEPSEKSFAQQMFKGEENARRTVDEILQPIQDTLSGLEEELRVIQEEIRSNYSRIKGTPELNKLSSVEREIRANIKRNQNRLKSSRKYYSSAGKYIEKSGIPENRIGELTKLIDSGPKASNILGMGLEYIERNPVVGIVGVAAVGAAMFLRQMFTGVHPQAQIDGINRSNEGHSSDFGSRRDILNSFSMRHAAGIAGVGAALFGIGKFNEYNSPSTLEWGRASQFGLAAENQRGAISSDYDHGMSLSGQGITTEGTAMHAAIQRQFIAMNPKTVEEYAIWDPESKLTGHIDLVSEMNIGGKNVWVPTEIKSISEEGLAKLTTPKEGHRAQAQFYLHYLAKQAEVEGREAAPFEQFIYVSRQDPTNYKIMRVDRDEQEFQFYLNRYRAYQDELKGEWATPKEMSSHFKIIKDVAAQRLEIKAKSIMYPEAKPMTPEQWGEYAQDIMAREYGFKYQKRNPEELSMARISKGIRQSYPTNPNQFEAMKPHPGTDFPGGRISWTREVIGLQTVKSALTETDKEIIKNLTPRDIIKKYKQAGLGVKFDKTARATSYFDSDTFSIVIGKADYKSNPAKFKETLLHEGLEAGYFKRAEKSGRLDKLDDNFFGGHYDTDVLIEHSRFSNNANQLKQDLARTKYYFDTGGFEDAATNAAYRKYERRAPKLISIVEDGLRSENNPGAVMNPAPMMEGGVPGAKEFFERAKSFGSLSLAKMLSGTDVLSKDVNRLTPMISKWTNPGLDDLTYGEYFITSVHRMNKDLNTTVVGRFDHRPLPPGINKKDVAPAFYTPSLNSVFFSVDGYLKVHGIDLKILAEQPIDPGNMDFFTFHRTLGHELGHVALKRNLIERARISVHSNQLNPDERSILNKLISENQDKSSRDLYEEMVVDASGLHAAAIVSPDWLSSKAAYGMDREELFRVAKINGLRSQKGSGHVIGDKGPLMPGGVPGAKEFMDEARRLVTKTGIEIKPHWHNSLSGLQEHHKFATRIMHPNEVISLFNEGVLIPDPTKAHLPAAPMNQLDKKMFGGSSERIGKGVFSPKPNNGRVVLTVPLEEFSTEPGKLLQSNVPGIRIHSEKFGEQTLDDYIKAIDFKISGQNPNNPALNDIRSPIKGFGRDSMNIAREGAERFRTIAPINKALPTRLTTMKRQGRTGAKYGPQMPVQNVRLNYNERTFSRMSGTVA